MTSERRRGPAWGGSEAPVRVLFVGGWGRSGSTLLARMLGEIPGFFPAGEVREVWRGQLENRLCGCGTPFRSCSFWTEVGEAAFGGWREVDLAEMVRLKRKLDRGWSMPVLLSSTRSFGGTGELATYLAGLDRLYRGMREVSGGSTIVDSSKLPSHALLLRRVPRADLRVVHLVRDSRGVLFSWQKRVQRVDAPGQMIEMRRYGPVSAALRYDLYNFFTQTLSWQGHPYLLMRYEDLVADPASRLAEVLAFAGAAPSPDALTFMIGGNARLGVNHMLDGNPSRFLTGMVPVSPDDAWRRCLPFAQRLPVTLLTSPLLIRYGYRPRLATKVAGR